MGAHVMGARMMGARMMGARVMGSRVIANDRSRRRSEALDAQKPSTLRSPRRS